VQTPRQRRLATRGAVPLANDSQARIAAGESSRVRQADSRTRERQPFIPRLEYEVKVPRDAQRARTTSAAAPTRPTVALEVEQLELGDAVLSVPEEMTAHSTYTVAFRPRDDLRQRLQRALADRAMPAETVDTRIDAVLSADDQHAFDIAPDKSSGTEWSWKVTPREAGRHTFHVNVTLTADTDGKKYVKAFPPITQSIMVTEPAAEFQGLVDAPWFWPAAITMLIAAVVLSLAIWRRAVA
jgi:hypothetical protein